MARALDHCVLTSRDLDAQADLFTRLGFTVGARNVHPWGTRNHIVQLEGAFLELLSEGADLSAPNPFSTFVAQSLAVGEGFAMLALRSANAAADRAAFAEAGLLRDTFGFGRTGQDADGRDVGLAFTLTFAGTPLAEAAGFFTCEHHHPERFWSVAAQAHPNGARGLAAAVMTADNPAALGEFLSGFTGQREMRSTSMGLSLDTGAGRIDVLTPAAFRHRFGEDVGGDPPLFRAIEVEVADLDALARILDTAGLAASRLADRVVVPSAAAFGTALGFVAG